ncbi:MAG TPA: hypothetical protein PLX23_06815 [Candidatus Hydrogenedens sp.]|nr:hypothetical protein [Candidatus Hydrogenedens sp.]
MRYSRENGKTYKNRSGPGVFLCVLCGKSLARRAWFSYNKKSCLNISSVLCSFKIPLWERGVPQGRGVLLSCSFAETTPSGYACHGLSEKIGK